MCSSDLSISVIGAVLPPDDNLSEPVTQNTLRVTKVFWGLDANLAYQRHFPAINWLSSYSLYTERLDAYWDEKFDDEWSGLRVEAMSLLEEEDQLREVMRLVGIDALSKEGTRARRLFCGCQWHRTQERTPISKKRWNSSK